MLVVLTEYGTTSDWCRVGRHVSWSGAIGRVWNTEGERSHATNRGCKNGVSGHGVFRIQNLEAPSKMRFQTISQDDVYIGCGKEQKGIIRSASVF